MTSNVRWILDHEVNNCSQCQDEFSLLRRKHHCRVCGKLFCAECSAFKLLIPTTKLIQHPNCTDDFHAPLRTCSHCARSLHHVQEDLRKLLAKAHAETIVERLSPERYLNRPFSNSLQSEIRKATHTLWNFTSDNIVEGRDRIPRELLQGAKGLAFLTIAKAGFCFTGRLGTGLVIARLSDGSWSAPSSIMISGMGWGFQAGMEMTDVVLILATPGAVDAFSSRAQVSVGTELAISLGPVGRSAGTDLHAGSEGASAAFSYAHSKGLFFGISLEASAITSRADINRAFYGMDVKPAALLSGVIPRPVAAEPLYQALAEVLNMTTISGQQEGAITMPGSDTEDASSSSSLQTSAGIAARRDDYEMDVITKKETVTRPSLSSSSSVTATVSASQQALIPTLSSDSRDKGIAEASFRTTSVVVVAAASNASTSSAPTSSSSSSKQHTAAIAAPPDDDGELDPLTLDSFLENLAPLSSSGADGGGGDHEDILDDYASLAAASPNLNVGGAVLKGTDVMGQKTDKAAAETALDPLEDSNNNNNGSDDRQAQSRYEEIRF